MVRYRQEGPQSWCLITKTRCAGDVACATRDIALFLCERCVEWHGIRSWILRDLKRVWSGLSFLRRAQHSQLRVKTGRHVVGASLGPSETPANFAWRVSNLFFPPLPALASQPRRPSTTYRIRRSRWFLYSSCNDTTGLT
jgi:hypothetical protein